MDEPFVVGLPNASSSVTVKALVAEVPWVIFSGAEVIASWVPVPALIVSTCVPDVSPLPAAVMVGNPATVSA